MKGVSGIAGATLILALAAPAQASVVSVSDGVLSLSAGPTEPARVFLGLTGPPGVVGVGKGYFEGRYRPGQSAWPGPAPAPGAGCQGTTCSGVQSIDIAFGDGDDASNVFARAPLALPIRLAGGGGHDGLQAEGTPATLDGGPGDDFIRLERGTAIGGEGDDVIKAIGGTGRVVVDCGPGNDAIRLEAGGFDDPRKTGRISADPATCPPVLTPLLALGPFTPGPKTVFYVPKDRRFRLPVFKATEPVEGTITLRRPRGRGGACAPPVHFGARAGQAVAPVFRLKRWIARQVATLPASRARACLIAFTGTDPQGEPFTSETAPDWPTPGDDAYAYVRFVSHKAKNGRRPPRP